MRTVHFEVVTGALAPADAGRLRAVGGPEATFDPVRDAVCLAREDGGGALLGASFVKSSAVPLVGGRRFWLYHHALAPAALDHKDALLSATFAALDRGFEDVPGAIGLCLVVDDLAEMRRRPQAHWEDPPLLYVGYVAGPRQVRVAYFAGARIGMDVHG